MFTFNVGVIEVYLWIFVVWRFLIVCCVW